MSPNLQSSFWERMGLEKSHGEDCLRAVEELYPGKLVEEFEYQGYCSFTFRVSELDYTTVHHSKGGRDPSVGFGSEPRTPDAVVVQIRPTQHQLDLQTVHAASRTYGTFVPKTRNLDHILPARLLAFELDMMLGIPFSRCQPSTTILRPSTWSKQVSLVQSFASFMSRAWPSVSNPTCIPRNSRADSPVAELPTLLSECTGRVGANIIPKLNKLARHLPDAALRNRAAEVRDKILELQDYPVVLNHGDLIPSNVLVHAETWQITGVVDWAEAEWLPFGSCLYGLEHLLGYLDRPESYVAGFGCTTWRYFSNAPGLRDMFWARLYNECPGLKERKDDVALARDLGVLLWYGYAWDEGAIDRVVNEADDTAEVECLKTFLRMSGSGKENEASFGP
ncbi:hypothetical protein K504DRAFT_469261 [Pleomassaria siparia CBS 279.74]|uniref:Aminoglycoside phosphotransferase domain-containing protein n=1 Tax=Pleomassaria siparia CBS 279.74 TaxID=1314801 RepID=A0A6G1KPW2_9PLEO|nr:hypothetical protein K504DRAFT_469261 [Pleomassaria siparia CBS 279.74]